MTTTMKTMLIAGATFGLLSGANRAPAQEEVKMNYRCENAKMRADASELSCMDRCERKAEKQPEARQAPFLALCAADCHRRCEERKKKVEEGAKCGGSSETADPQRCAAKHLGALAQLNMCLASCDIAPSTPDVEPSPEQIACQQHCDERYTAARDRIGESAACALGGVPVCVYQ